jgi:hypothetical protein
MNRASGIPAISGRHACQCLQLQGSSVGVNRRSLLMIFAVALGVSTS